MAANKIGKISTFSNFNANWYLKLFWSEELIGNDENCIQGHFFDATVSKMGAKKIDKLLMVSDFNENRYLGVFWSEELVGNDEICIQDHFYEDNIETVAS
jgi:3-hydroxymyristoyl/3-hydroxydecanoyl-(acyl carrier protein) dehydratase